MRQGPSESAWQVGVGAAEKQTSFGCHAASATHDLGHILYFCSPRPPTGALENGESIDRDTRRPGYQIIGFTAPSTFHPLQ